MAKSLSHTKYMCKYHIIFIPKYCRKVIYNKLRSDIQKYIQELVSGKDAKLEGNTLTIGNNTTEVKAIWEIMKGVEYINYLYENKGNENGLYNPKFTSNNVEYDTGIRYRGSDPNNYVYFNCNPKDENGVSYGSKDYVYNETSCELWRIIGVFDTQSEISGTAVPKIKLVKDEPFKDAKGNAIGMSWDSSADGTVEGETAVNGGWGVNEWSQVDLKNMINTYYLETTNSCIYCNGTNQSNCKNDCSSIVTPLNIMAQNMIDNAVWKLGATEYA